jgi:hypothetical protein
MKPYDLSLRPKLIKNPFASFDATSPYRTILGLILSALRDFDKSSGAIES